MAPRVPELELADLFDEWDVPGRRIPVEGILEPTFRCNLNCVHCYVNRPAGDLEARGREVPLPRLKALVDEIVEAGTLNLLLTGGEVLLRPDFEELYVHAVEKGLLVTVFTNGTLVTDRVADLFARHPPLLVEISLYGMTRETYERITRVPGSYDKCLEGIQRLLDRRVPLKLKTMAMAWNRHEVADMKRFAAERGLGFRYDGLLNARVDCGADRNGELQMSAPELLALELADPEGRARLEKTADFVREAAAQEQPVVEEVYSCGAGAVSFTVDPYGSLQMCQLSRKAAFDLAQHSFAEVWDHRFPELRARKWQKNDVCRSCSLISMCGSCPGAAELASGDIEAQVPRFCEIAHLRAYAMLGEESGHRRDATCCLGRGTLAAQPAATLDTGHGCGSCGHATAPPLIQLERRSAPDGAAKPA
jgi:radical SAM protein with 4Fe4S-binding SPASM domain